MIVVSQRHISQLQKVQTVVLNKTVSLDANEGFFLTEMCFALI